MGAASTSAPTLHATVETGRSRNVHRLFLDKVEIARRVSASRQYTHVLAIDSRAGWTAWSWHLTAPAAHKAALTIRGDYKTRVVEVAEVAR